MFRCFKYLKSFRNRLIVCLKLEFGFAGEKISPCWCAAGGTPPRGVASFFPRSSEASYVVSKKIGAFLNCEAGNGNGIRGLKK